MWRQIRKVNFKGGACAQAKAARFYFLRGAMRDYTVKGITIKKDGKFYKPGSLIALTEKEALSLKRFLEPPAPGDAYERGLKQDDKGIEGIATGDAPLNPDSLPPLSGNQTKDQGLKSKVHKGAKGKKSKKGLKAI